MKSREDTLVESLLHRCNKLAESLRVCMDQQLASVRVARDAYAEYVQFREEIAKDLFDDTETEDSSTTVTDL